jgi:hypothetical protein
LVRQLNSKGKPIRPTTVAFGISVAPGLLDLSTYKGASPISFPFTKPKRFDIFYYKIVLPAEKILYDIR